MTSEQELNQWKEEWKNCFGFMAQNNPSDSFESIDEVASLISESTTTNLLKIKNLENQISDLKGYARTDHHVCEMNRIFGGKTCMICGKKIKDFGEAEAHHALTGE